MRRSFLLAAAALLLAPAVAQAQAPLNVYQTIDIAAPARKVAPLPITDYDSTIQVLSTGAGKSAVVWRSRFLPKAGAKDDVVMAAVTQLYLGGLQNLKQTIEGR